MRALKAIFILSLAVMHVGTLEAETRTFRVSFVQPTAYTDGTSLNPATDIKEYRLYFSTASYLNLNLQTPILIPPTKHSVCITVNFANEIYVAMTAVATDNATSDLSPVAYYLRGNIYDRYDPATGYNIAPGNVATGKVDIADLQTLRQYWGTAVTHLYYDCSTDFTITLVTDQQAADINRDGRVDFLDQVEVGLTYGNTTH